MENYIFSIGIIPVQEFISEATRSRDLKAGSVMLSWIMSRALLQIKNEIKDTEIVLPAISDADLYWAERNFKETLEQQEYSIPNRASGFCKAANISSLEKFFNNLNQTCVVQSWKDIYEEAKKTGIISAEFIQDYLSNAGPPPVQLIWVVLKREEETPEIAIENINIKFLNIKRTRPIIPWHGKPIAKCTQCGKREALGPISNIKKWRDWVKALEKEKWVKQGYRIDTNERLCYCCFIKRFAGYLSATAAGSTNEIACREWLFRIRGLDDLKVLLTNLSNLQQSLALPDNIPWYSDSIFRKLNAIYQDVPDKRAIVQEIQVKQNQISNKIREQKQIGIKPQPSKYLAVITFDGDDMGQHAIEAGIANKISEFSRKIVETLRGEEGKAEIFYIGGDEGLLLTPMETVLNVVLQIQALFTETFPNGMTISMGVTLFNRERPLGAAIRLAHQALDKSKALKNKNALSFCVQTASGNVFTTSEHWGTAWQCFRDFLDLIQNPERDVRLSMSWPYEIEKLLLSLQDSIQDKNKWGEPDFRQAVKNEIKRITYRKLQTNGENKRAQKDRAWQDIFEREGWLTDPTAETFENLGSHMHLLAFLARESSYQPSDFTSMEETENE